jgi:hypothetical protein
VALTAELLVLVVFHRCGGLLDETLMMAVVTIWRYFLPKEIRALRCTRTSKQDFELNLVTENSKLKLASLVLSTPRPRGATSFFLEIWFIIEGSRRLQIPLRMRCWILRQ